MPPKPHFRSSCVCGSVVLQTFGPPIVAAACHCSDCRDAARQIESLPDAPSVLDPSGGTAFLLFRKDRMSPVQGAELLRGLKLKPSSATTRCVTTCCNTMMYLGFDDSKHWVAMNRDRFQDEVPAVRMRICTGSASAETVPTDLPRHRGYPLPFIGRLMLAGFAKVIGR